MALLHDVQLSLLDETKTVAPALLKLRFLADKLGSEPLEEWVKHEISGYEIPESVPEYRVVPLMFFGNFENMVRKYTNQPIPPLLIAEYAGEEILTHPVHESIASIEHKVMNAGKDDRFLIDVSNLMLLLQGKIYERMVLQSIKATFGIGHLIRIQTTVRASLLDLTLELEKRLPAIAEIVVGGGKIEIDAGEAQVVSQIFNQTINGNVTNIANTGKAASVTVNVIQGNTKSLAEALVSLGFTEDAAAELSGIAATEKPADPKVPFGTKAKKWISEKLIQGIDGVLAAGGRVGQKELTEAFQQYYDQFPPFP